MIRKNKKHAFNASIDEVNIHLTDGETALNQLAAEDLLNLLSKLPTGYRVVFNMFAIEGFSHKEIAEHLGVTESTSKSQYSRARAFLKESIERLEKRASKQ